MNKRVLLGMSGGVDSTIAAVILKNQGYDVICAFMKNFSESKSKLTGNCSWKEDRKVAQTICAELNLPLITIDGEKEYLTKVISPMFKGYSKGQTPNPDIGCNTEIKFPILIKTANKLGCDWISTGHYARIKKKSGKYTLMRGKDETKDQSYFLYQLSESTLKRTIFPIGDLKKEDVRKLAQKYKFPNWNKQSSRGICFVGKVSMQDFLKQKISQKEGIVKSPKGEILGTHRGISFYTKGQRVGPSIGIEFDESHKNLTNNKWFVAKKEKGNILVIAPENHKILSDKEIIVKDFISHSKLNKTNKLTARYRHLGKLCSGKLIISNKKKKAIFLFNKPQSGIAEGQHIVFYKGKEIIAGGVMYLKN